MEKHRAFSFENAEIKEEAELGAAYSDSALLDYVKQQETGNGETAALFTDIDHTFMRAGKEAEAAELYRKAIEKNYPVISVTGNDYAGIVSRIEKGDLPPFQAIAGSVGTEIWVLQKGMPPTYKKDLFYEKLLERTGFDRARLVSQAKTMLARFSSEHPA
ncbi:MAG: HAD family hydrolase, partial [Patescibacteria group bacterium]|nr:HAD family hydrolase [Patescibacteria group bacterium]